MLVLFLLGQNYFDRVVGSLSGGEKSRLILATLFLARCNFLVLDEPTNHLDLESREALVEALASFDGTLLMVAHDRHLLNEAADQIWALSPAGFEVFQYGFEEYNEARKRLRQNENAQALEQRRTEASRITGLSREDLKRRKRDQAEARKVLYRTMKPLQEAYEALEKELETVFAAQGETESLLADPEVYADSSRATGLLKDFHALQKKSEDLIEKLALAEEALAPYEAQKAALLEGDDEG